MSALQKRLSISVGSSKKRFLRRTWSSRSVCSTSSLGDTMAGEEALQPSRPDFIDATSTPPSFNSIDESHIHILSRDHIVAGQTLGQGSFCTVQEAIFVHAEEPEELIEECDGKLGIDNNTLMIDFSVSSSISRCTSEASVCPSPYLPGESPSHEACSSAFNYVIKHLRRDLDETQTLRGQSDLLIECSVLQTLSHPNIISIKAVSQTLHELIKLFDSDPASIPKHVVQRQPLDDFFFVEERLEETLRSRFRKWKTTYLECGIVLRYTLMKPEELLQAQEDLQLSSIPTAPLTGANLQKRHSMLTTFLRKRVSTNRRVSANNNFEQSWAERIQVLRNISSALQYLHKKRILYRDLKPDNIGFTSNGTLKLFDFGMAKTLRDRDLCNGDGSEESLYLLTGYTGSPRYMCPEVSSNEPYNEKADVYSFGILAWQLCSLALPFKGYSFTEHFDLIAIQKKRPTLAVELTKEWPTGLPQLIFECWSHKIEKRPSFDLISHYLELIEQAKFGPTSQA